MAYEKRPDVYKTAVAKGLPASGPRAAGSQFYVWDGGQWLINAKRAGIPTGSQPVAGALAVWGVPNSASYGHVAYVEQVDSTTRVRITECNYDWHGSCRTIWENPKGGADFQGYIYGGPAGSGPSDTGGGGSTYHYQPYAADFDGDGLADIGLRDANTGKFFIKHGPSFGDQIDYQWAVGAHYQPYAADFNGDGRADIGMRDPNTGKFFIKFGTNAGDEISYQWAVGAQYQPYAADFNGDGRADIGMRDSTTGIFFIKFGTGPGEEKSYQWAAGAQYQPFAADFNGDGLADIGLRDATTGKIFIKHSPDFNDQLTYDWAAG